VHHGGGYSKNTGTGTLLLLLASPLRPSLHRIVVGSRGQSTFAPIRFKFILTKELFSWSQISLTFYKFLAHTVVRGEEALF
jgi:hypothetical protein